MVIFCTISTQIKDITYNYKLRIMSFICAKIINELCLKKTQLKVPLHKNIERRGANKLQYEGK